jgi:hypothetical protein
MRWLYHSSASVLLMRTTTNIIWKRHTSLFMNKPMNVRIRAEPLNPRDPSAIAIDLDYGTG